MGYPEAQYAVDELTQGIVPIVKSVQRGVTTKAGTVTIGAVDVGKCLLRSVSKGSAGTVAASGSMSIPAKSSNITIAYDLSTSGGLGRLYTSKGYGGGDYSTTFSVSNPANTGTLSGGTTDLTVKLYSAVLTNSTTITCDGPVEWELLEFY